MIRTLAAAAAAALATLALAGGASAQTYGQPVYLNVYGRPVGGTPLSELETRPYARTGRWADGYADRPLVHVPAPGYYGRSFRYDGRREGYDRPHHDDRPYARRHAQGGYGYGRHDPPPYAGYRDEWGYDDDRPPSTRRWSDHRRAPRYERECGCGDVYLYDR